MWIRSLAQTGGRKSLGVIEHPILGRLKVSSGGMLVCVRVAEQLIGLL